VLLSHHHAHPVPYLNRDGIEIGVALDRRKYLARLFRHHSPRAMHADVLEESQLVLSPVYPELIAGTVLALPRFLDPCHDVEAHQQPRHVVDKPTAG
jgi:hypothetical protein